MSPVVDSSGSPRPGTDGLAIIGASWAGTVAFVASAVAADLSPSLARVALLFAGALFAAGCAVFFWAFLVMAGRSRSVRLELAQVWFLAGPPIPGPVRRSLLGALAVQVVAALVTAGVRPYTSLAAGVLVPMYGLALCGLWGARHGVFPPLEPQRSGRGGVRSDDADQ